MLSLVACWLQFEDALGKKPNTDKLTHVSCESAATFSHAAGMSGPEVHAQQQHGCMWPEPKASAVQALTVLACPFLP